MKTKSLPFIISLAALTTSAFAASNPSDSEPIELHPYVVTTPRYRPVEQQIHASLKEFSQQASTPIVTTPELTFAKTQTAQYNPLADAARSPLPGPNAKS